MKLRVNTILGRRYIRAGEEIPDDQVPPAIARYAVTASENEKGGAPPPLATTQSAAKARKPSKGPKSPSKKP